MTSHYRSRPQTPYGPIRTNRSILNHKPIAAFIPPAFLFTRNHCPLANQTQSAIRFFILRNGTTYPHQAPITKRRQLSFHSHVYNCAQSYPQAVYKNVQNPPMGLSPEFLHTLWIKLCTSSPPGTLFECFRKSPGCSPQKFRN